MRRLALGLALMGSLIPGLSHALGLGEIKVDSALNQPLRAEIAVLAASPDEVIDIVAKLADEQAFERLGISREYILSKLQFKPAVRDGVPVILVTTKKPVKEPFLDFLLEVRWPKGRLLREYTILLDPPVMMEQRAVATRAPEVTEAPAEMAPEPAPEPSLPPASVAVIEPEPEPAAEPEPVVLPEPEPVAAAEPEPEAYVVPAPEPEPVMLPEEPVAYQPQEDALFPLIPIGDEEATTYYAEAEPEAEISDGYKVAANDTLWEIANQARPDGVSVNQMMVAMLHANPDAFYQNNINNLKRGVILRMPTQEELEAVDNREANTEVSEQYALWREYRSQVAGAAIPQEAVPAVDEGTEAAAEEAQVAEVEEPAAELQILAPESATETGESVTAGGEDLASLQNDLALARESLESARQENQDLVSRVDQLEQMLQKQERLMNLKDEQLTELQQQIEGTVATAPVIETMEEAPEVAEAPAAEAPAMEAEPVTEMPKAEVASPEEVEGEASVKEAEVAEPAPGAEQVEEPMLVVEEEVVAVVEPPAEPEAAPPVQPEPVQKPELEAPTPAKAPSFIDDLLSDRKMLGIVGGGVILVLALIATLLRRMGKNREAQEAAAPAPAFEEPIFEEEAPAAAQEETPAVDETVAEVAEETPAEPAVEEGPIVGDSTQVLDLSKQEAVAEAAAEAAAEADDTISEADVYLAYGLHQQCEDLLKNAIEQNPDRNDYRAKLLENYFASKEQEKFEVAASELHDRLGDTSDPLWSRVVVMGKELAPDNALFKDVDVGDMSIDDIVQEKPDAAEFDLTAEDLAVGAVEEVEAETEVMPEAKAGAEEADLEFDIGDIDLGDIDLGETSSEVKETDDTATLDIESDLEIDAGDLDIEELGDDIAATDLDLELDVETPVEEEAAAQTEVMTEPPKSPPETMIMEGPPDIDLAVESEAEKHDTGTLDISDMDLGDLDLGEETEVPADLGLDEAVDFGGAENEVTEEMTDDAASFDLGDEMDLEEDLGLPDSEDEVSTKLDLAKAYIDMGDNDGAKSTLEEVMNEGDDNQKKEAQDLLSQIS